MPKKFETDEERREYARNMKRQQRSKKSESVEQPKQQSQNDNIDEYISFFENIEKHQYEKIESVEQVKPTEQKTHKYQFDSMEEIISFLKSKMLEDESIKRQLIEDADNEEYIIANIDITKEDKDAIFKIHVQRCSKYGYNLDDMQEFDIKYFLQTDKKKEYFSVYYIKYKNGYGYYTPDGIKFTTDLNSIINQYKIFPKYKNLIEKWLE
jgi:hypothetical protein